MSPGLSRSQDLAHEVRRVLLGQLDDARSRLSGTRLSDDSIHQARKTLKKARATLRLLRESIPESAYRQENLALRDIARSLSAARDAAVMLATLDQLEQHHGGSATSKISTALKKTLEAQQLETSRKLHGSKDRRRSPATRVNLVKQRVARMPIAESDGWSGIGVCLRRASRNGRRALRRARRDRSEDALHEWRKRTKHLWHQTQVLEPLKPGLIAEFGDQAHRLSDYLGDDRDLALLREKVAGLHATLKHSGDPKALLTLIDQCREQLQEKAFLLGTRLHEESPADFVARFERYWDRWRRKTTG
jgi:CHAD domain-containing protein